MGQRGDGFAEDQVDPRNVQRRDLAIDRHGRIRRRMQIGAVGGADRADGTGNAARTMRPARGLGLVQRPVMQRGELRFDAGLGQPITQDGIGVGSGDGGARGKEIGMHLRHQAGMVAHHLGRPERRRPVSGAVHQLLAHAAVEEGDPAHRATPRPGWVRQAGHSAAPPLSPRARTLPRAIGHKRKAGSVMRGFFRSWGPRGRRPGEPGRDNVCRKYRLRSRCPARSDRCAASPARPSRRPDDPSRPR